MIHNKLILIVLLSFCTFHLKGQTVLLEVEEEELDSLQAESGPNTEIFFHPYLGGSFILGSSDEALPVKQGNSLAFSAGMRYKHKLGNIYSFGGDFEYNASTYRIDQTDNKRFPDSVKYSKEQLTFNHFAITLYNRFNFDPDRGNVMGVFLDLGGSIEWAFDAKQYYEFENLKGEILKVTKKKMDYRNPLQYYLRARFGFNRYVLNARYRLSDVFKSSFNYPELPPIFIGVQIGLHQ